MKRKELNRIIHKAMGKLDYADRDLINELYFKHNSIHMLAMKYNISRTAVRYRRDKALERLKEIVEKGMRG
jgi:DNA-directed RNA polymerase specialized sigma subunit